MLQQYIHYNFQIISQEMENQDNQATEQNFNSDDVNLQSNGFAQSSEQNNMSNLQVIAQNPQQLFSQRNIEQQNSSISMSDSIVTSQSIGAEDELAQAAKQLSSFDELFELVTKFEETAFTTKKRINGLNRDGQQSSVIPPTLKLCSQTLNKLIHADLKDPNYAELAQELKDIEKSISQKMKTSNELNKTFGKFKGEFFAINELIVNKDISQLKYSVVQAQMNKQTKLLDKMDDLESNMNSNSNGLINLKQEFINALELVQMKKNTEVKVEYQDAKDRVEKLDEIHRELKEDLEQASMDAKKIVPQTKEQRSLYSQIQSQIQKIQRQEQKFATGFDQLPELDNQISTKAKFCDDFVDQQKSDIELGAMLGNTKTLEKFVECLKLVQKYNQKIAILEKEASQIKDKLAEIKEMNENYQSTIQGEMKQEIDTIIEKIREISNSLDQEVQVQNERLDAFEEKLLEIKIADADQFFLILNKEVVRCKSTLDSVESTKDMHKDSSEEIQINFESGQFNTEELQQLRQNLKFLQKSQDVDVPKARKNIDQLELYVIKSLKNQLNEDNKKSQQLISKVKKSYEELQKKYEKVSLTANESFGMLQQFNDRFETADMERSNEIELLEERLQEEVEQIGGQKKQEGEEDDSDSLHQQKRNIIASINTLVNKFNENNKLIKESAKVVDKQQTTESTLNDLIHKNQLIQNDCNNIIENIDNAKQFSQDIFDRLGNLISNQILQDLIKNYQQKHDLIEECEIMKQKAEVQRNKVSLQISKGIENVKEIQKKLNMFNPLNQTGNLKTEKDFLEEITSKIDKTTELKDNLEKALDQFSEFQEKIGQCMEPIIELGSREVQMNPEIQKIKDDLAQVIEEMNHEDQNVLPPNFNDIQNLQKEIKELVDDEMKKRLEDASGSLEKIDTQLGEYNELLGAGLKKNKFYSDKIAQASKKDSNDLDDQQLNDKLAELKQEQLLIDKDYNGLDLKLKDLKKKKQEAQKALNDIQKSPQTYSPAQIDNLQTNLEEQLDKLNQIDDKLKSLDEMVGIKAKDLDFNIQSSIDRKELTSNIAELDTEVDKDLLNLKEMLEKLPLMLLNMRGTIEAMQEGTNKNADYEEKKDEIEEQLEELEDLSQTLQKFDGDYQFFKDRKDGLKTNVKSIDQKQKVNEQLNELKDESNNLLSDVIDCQEQLEDLKNDIGDCEIPTNIAKRKQDLTKFNTKFDRISKELGNLKKTNKTGTTDAKTDQMLSEVEEKLKDLGKDKLKMNTEITKELENISSDKIDDFSTNHELIRKLHRYKDNIDESNIKLKEVEDILQEVVKKLTELDMENSLDLLSLKAQELRQRLQESHANLKKISNSGVEMDGNTSNNEEEEFINALKNEMPEVSENIDTTLKLLKEIEKIVVEVKQTLNTDKMMDLKDKVNIAQENVEESENLVNNLEKEILEWNAQKKLAKRDQELEEIQILCSDYIDDLSQEQQNTEIELEKNIEKQDENKDQDMVDKDGNKVDIMKDLVKLEGQMNSYLTEIAMLLNDIQQTEGKRAQCFDEFSHDLPSVVLEQRKKRKIENEKNKNSFKQLKRPAMIGAQGKKSGVFQDHGQEDDVDHYKMISINCKFKKTIKQMLKDLKNINNRRKDLEDRYQQMRKEVFKIKQIKLYKPVAGDVVDEMFAGYLNKAKLTIEVQRIAANNYMFGTRKILAKIINGRLVIRVGGGYMNAEEFIDQYGRIEMMKMMKKDQMAKEQGYQERPKNTNQGNIRRGTVAPNSEMGLKLGNEIKTMMKKQLESITPYQGHQTMNDGTMQGKLRASYNPMNRSNKPKLDGRQSIGAENLVEAHNLLKNGYKTANMGSQSSIASPDPFAKKMSSQMSATPGRLGLTPLGMSRKNVKASKSPQRNLKLGENTLQSSASTSSMLQTTKNSKIGQGNRFERRGTMMVQSLNFTNSSSSKDLVQKKTTLDTSTDNKNMKITPRRAEGTKSGLK